MNINDLLKQQRQFINIDKELEGTQPNSGKREDIIKDIYSGRIIPITTNSGEIIGISVNSEVKDIVEDNIAQARFERQYLNLPIMDWVLSALQNKYNNISLEEALKQAEEEESVRLQEKRESNSYNDELPESLDVDISEIDGYDNDYDETDSDNINSVKRYLREEYGHYLNKQNPFDLEMDSDGETLYISNIVWGRKI